MDFTFPIASFGVHLYTDRKEHRILGDAFRGIFDQTSYFLFGVALLMMVLMLWQVTGGKSLTW